MLSVWATQSIWVTECAVESFVWPSVDTIYCLISTGAIYDNIRWLFSVFSKVIIKLCFLQVTKWALNWRFTYEHTGVRKSCFGCYLIYQLGTLRQIMVCGHMCALYLYEQKSHPTITFATTVNITDAMDEALGLKTHITVICIVLLMSLNTT